MGSPNILILNSKFSLAEDKERTMCADVNKLFKSKKMYKPVFIKMIV